MPCLVYSNGKLYGSNKKNGKILSYTVHLNNECNFLVVGLSANGIWVDFFFPFTVKADKKKNAKKNNGKSLN